MGSDSAQIRASGRTQAEEVVKEEVEKDFMSPSEEVPAEERKIQWRTPGFARIRTEWRGDDRYIVGQVLASVEERLIHAFPDAYALMHEIYDLVRTPEVNQATGEIEKDRFGYTVWKRTITGSFEEDFTKLSYKQKDNFMFQITTRIFGWEQQATRLWTEAMLAKAQYEERFSIAYDAPRVGTIDDRIAKGKIDAADERYFAIFVAALSRQADSVVRSLALLGQRLKDSMIAT